MGAPFLHFRGDLVAHSDGFFQPFLPGAGEGRWIGKTPVQPRGISRKNRAAFGARFVANGDDVAVKSVFFKELEDGLRLFLGNIDAHVGHCGDGEGIERAGFESGAFRVDFAAAEVVEKRFGHLAAGAVMDANKEDFQHFAERSSGAISIQLK